MRHTLISYIAYSVIAIHLLFLALLLFSFPSPPKKKQHKPLIVKTCSITPTLIHKTKTEHSPFKSAPSPSTPAPKKSAVNKRALQKETPAKKPAIKTQKPIAKMAKALAPAHVNKPHPAATLLKELDEQIAKIKENHKPSKQEQTPHSEYTPTALQIDTDLFPDKQDSGAFTNTLIAYLQSCLHLPEFGEVKIELTLRQDGTIAKLKVLKAESQENKLYLEKRLQHLKFPSFKEAWGKQAESTFILNFCNEL